MSEKNFYEQLADRIKNGRDPHELVMSELGELIADNKEDFIEVLKSSDVQVRQNPSLSDLVDLFIDNAAKNDRLLIGTSLFIAEHNKVSGADGESEISDTGVKAVHKVMYSNFVNAIAGAVTAGANVANTALQGRNQKKYGAQMALEKNTDARKALVQSLINKKKKEADNKQKKFNKEQKTLQIALFVLGGVAVAGTAIYLFIRYRKKK